MADNQKLTEYYKYLVFIFLFGFGGTVWGGLSYYIGIPIAYLDSLGATSFQISLVGAIFWAGFAFPQIWAAYKSESLAIKKRFIGWSLIVSSFGFLLAGLYILLTKSTNDALSIWLFLLFYIWAAALAGLYIPAQFALLFKIIPTARLGHLLGILFAVQFGAIFISGFAITAINNAIPAPMNYAVLFLMTFVITLVACMVVFALKEPEGEVAPSSSSFGEYLGKFVRLYKDDKPFLKFLVGKWLMSGHYVMLAFMLAYLLKQRGFDPVDAGKFPGLQGLGLMIGGFTITKIADMYGPKYMLVTSQVMAILYTVLAWLIPSSSTALILGAFVVTGLAQVSDNVGYSNMCLLLCPSADKSTYVAATNVGIVPFMIFLPMLFGKMMDLGPLNYNGTFGIALAMMVAAIIYILVVVKNPQAYTDMKAAAKS